MALHIECRFIKKLRRGVYQKYYKKGNKEKTKDLKNILESDIEDVIVCFDFLDENAEDDGFTDVDVCYNI